MEETIILKTTEQQETTNETIPTKTDVDIVIDYVKPDKNGKKLIRQKLLDGEQIDGWKLQETRFGKRLVKDKRPKTISDKVTNFESTQPVPIRLTDTQLMFQHMIELEKKTLKQNLKLKKLKKKFKKYTVEDDEPTQGPPPMVQIEPETTKTPEIYVEQPKTIEKQQPIYEDYQGNTIRTNYSAQRKRMTIRDMMRMNQK